MTFVDLKNIIWRKAMLTKYVRDMSGNPVACVVAVGPGQIGVACCLGNREHFNKRFMRTIAAGRAVTGELPVVPNAVIDFTNNFEPITLENALEIEEVSMTARSYRYFKNEV